MSIFVTQYNRRKFYCDAIETFYNRKFDARCSCGSMLALAVTAPKSCLVTIVLCALLSLNWRLWTGLSREVVETLTPVRILLPRKLPIFLPLPHLQILLVPMVILTFWLLHVQT